MCFSLRVCGPSKLRGSRGRWQSPGCSHQQRKSCKWSQTETLGLFFFPFRLSGPWGFPKESMMNSPKSAESHPHIPQPLFSKMGGFSCLSEEFSSVKLVFCTQRRTHAKWRRLDLPHRLMGDQLLWIKAFRLRRYSSCWGCKAACHEWRTRTRSHFWESPRQRKKMKETWRSRSSSFDSKWGWSQKGLSKLLWKRTTPDSGLEAIGERPKGKKWPDSVLQERMFWFLGISSKRNKTLFQGESTLRNIPHAGFARIPFWLKFKESIKTKGFFWWLSPFSLNPADLIKRATWKSRETRASPARQRKVKGPVESPKSFCLFLLKFWFNFL